MIKKENKGQTFECQILFVNFFPEIPLLSYTYNRYVSGDMEHIGFNIRIYYQESSGKTINNRGINVIKITELVETN